MRELVYLSEAKLKQFVPEPRRFPWRLKSVSTPFGGAEVEPGAAPGIAERLHEVEAHVAKQARWYTEEGLRPGEWVQFEAPLNHSVLHCESIVFPKMVAFAEAASDDPIRLLLHGSAAHLVDAPCLPSLGTPGSPQFVFFRLTYAVSRIEDEAADEDVPALEEETARSYAYGIARGTRYLVEDLDWLTGPETAIWMRGYARITVVTEYEGVRYVVASPLYVEYAEPPEDAT